MKKSIAIIAILVLFCSILSCTSSPEEQAKFSIQSFMKVNLKNQSSYDPISFSKIEKLDVPDTMTNQRISFYKINHTYTVINEFKETVRMNVDFYLDQDYRVNGASVEDLTRNE